jgi:hypothetical protein
LFQQKTLLQKEEAFYKGGVHFASYINLMMAKTAKLMSAVPMVRTFTARLYSTIFVGDKLGEEQRCAKLWIFKGLIQFLNVN